MTSALPTELTSRLGAGHNVGSNCGSSSYYFTKFPRNRFSTRLVSGSFIYNNFLLIPFLGLDEHTIYNLVPLEKP